MTTASDEPDPKMSRLLKLAQKFNCFYLNGFMKGDCRPFVVDGHQVGLVSQNVIEQLLKYPEVFHIRAPEHGKQKIVELNPAFRGYNTRSQQVDRILREFRKQGMFVALKGWRDECYDVKSSTGSLLKMDRSATCLFGVRNYGVEINGYVRHPTKGLCIWLQQRSDTKQTWPGKWDNMVSGGLAVGYGVLETAIKEAAEEASIPGHLIKNLVSAGCVSFFFESERGLFPNTEFVYDLELPKTLCLIIRMVRCRTFNFYRPTKSRAGVYARLQNHQLSGGDRFSHPPCIITPENESNFTQVIELLHVPLQSLYTYRTTPNDGAANNAYVTTAATTTTTNQRDLSSSNNKNSIENGKALINLRRPPEPNSKP
uniref:Nudix hydrolase domain-containing protein n=1 Tax=Anopheles funestus TaxID=62324 RepID=A0A182RJA8_ANOFN